MLTYQELKENPRKFVTLTRLTPDEFDLLLPAFERAYERRYPASKTKAGTSRQRKAGAGRKGSLASIEQKLLFALVYQKSYPLQSVMGELFGMGQSQANEWIHVLLPILKQALDDLGYAPDRDSKKFKKKQDRKDPADSIIDGTERRRQRPKQADKQALHYSGKKKTYSDKNIVIVTAKKKQVSFLGQTLPGKTHDKHAAETDKISYPKHTRLHKDAGFQGYEPKVKQLFQPKKSRARKN